MIAPRFGHGPVRFKHAVAYYVWLRHHGWPVKRISGIRARAILI